MIAKFDTLLSRSRTFHERAGLGQSPTKIPIARLFAIVGIGLVIAPSMVTIARDHWSSQEGSQGPILAATGLWLLMRNRGALYRGAAPLRGAFWALSFVPLMLMYVFARIYRILPLESAMTYLIGLTAAVLYFGPALVRRFWFPFLYPAFLIVPPAILMADLTQPLKIWIASVSVELLYRVGYPVAAAGAMIQIGQYELLVRKVCAGLGSLLTLSAVGLFYVHLRRSDSLRFSAALLTVIIPVAILANIVRVVIIVLLTWYFGAEVGQGFAHELAGLLMFLVAMFAMFGIDFTLVAIIVRYHTRRGK